MAWAEQLLVDREAGVELRDRLVEATLSIASPRDREVQLRLGFGATTDAIDPRRRVGDPLRPLRWTPG